MVLTHEKLALMCGGSPSQSNVKSFCNGLNEFGERFGLDQPQRLAQYLGQMMHESAMFRYDREIWGPTPAQSRYDTRTDLGNTPERDGDGKRYSGRTSIQITGKFNYSQFTVWAQAFAPDAPNFVITPDAANTDPWEGLGPIWYWDTRSLNDPADKGDTRRVTKVINGGYNGLADRLNCVDRASLVLMGYGPSDIWLFQNDNGLVSDGQSGPKTRAKMHMLLSGKKSIGGKLPPLKPVAIGGGIIAAIAAIIARFLGV